MTTYAVYFSVKFVKLYDKSRIELAEKFAMSKKKD